MKLTLGLVVLGLATVLSNPVHESGTYKTVDHAFLEKQYKVLSLFKHINQPSYLEEHVKIYQTVQDPMQWLQLNKASFDKPEVVDAMMKFFHMDYMLAKGEIFSIAYEQHLEQAINLFKLFYYAKDFETFYHTAVVMGKYVNEGMFLYSMSVAVVHRQDCYGIILPSIYEVYPWYFFNTEVIQEAYKYKMMHEHSDSEEQHHHHHIVANYSGHYLNLHPEQSLSYYLEDIGVNSYFYYAHIHYPSWMDGEEFHIKNDKRGELWLTIYQSLVARYYMERLSHGKGQIPHFDWELPFEVPFYPSMQYPNGLTFPERPKFANLHDYFYQYGQHVNSKYAFSYSHVKDFERRLSDAIDSGVVWDLKQGKMMDIYENKHAVNNFGNLIQGNPDSPNMKFYNKYSMYATHLLGYSSTPLTWHKVAPSALEHTETVSRDPAFYMLMKKVLGFYHKFQNHMEPYHKKDLVFPGVTIEKVEMDRLITYFDQFESDISNVVYDSVDELKDDKFHVFATQERLNHKPFTYKIHVNSNQDTKAMVKVFLGPKYDEYGRYMNITENRWNFVPIDAFQWHLKSGQNIIKRSSQETEFYGRDRTTFQELYKKVMGAYKGQGEFHIDGEENYFYFPQRHMLPMGSYSGVPYQFYFMVHPYKAYEGQTEEMTYYYPRPGTGGGFSDDYPLFYPFDKPIKFGKMFVTEVPNSYFYETKVFHRNVDEAQVQQTHQH